MIRKSAREPESQSGAAQNRCIWMTAGVISFKLCPLDYDCDNCDFDQVMRSQVRSKKGGSKGRSTFTDALASPAVPSDPNMDSKNLPFFTFSPTRVDRKLCLHPAHLWVRRLEERQWRMGIDGLLAYTLPPPHRVELPHPNQEMARDRVFAKILAEPGEVLLTAPLSGRLLQVNPALARQPELLQQDPCGEGWLAVVDSSPHPSELKKFHAGPAGNEFLEEEAQHLRLLLKHKGIMVDQIGDTLPDGGLHIKYLHQILPAQVCLRLTLELIGSGKQAW